MNLGYLDPSSIDVAAWTDRESEGVLVVPNAGEMLFRADDVSWSTPTAAGQRQSLPEEVSGGRG